MPGTPKTLDEAIEHILCVGPLSEIKERAYLVIRDFMAQKFQTAQLRAEMAGDEKTLKALEDLFSELKKRS